MKENYIETYLRKHPKVFIELIFRWYPVDLKIHKKLPEILSDRLWDIISSNYFFITDSFFLLNFKEKINWEIASINYGHLWTEEVIETMEDKICWNSFASNTKINWNEKTVRTITKYTPRALCDNASFPWSIELIEKFTEKSAICFRSLSSNTGDFWTKEILMKYAYLWHWDLLSSNPSLPWDIELIDLYQGSWYWYELSSNTNVWKTQKIIKRFRANINWYAASGNRGFYWTIELLKSLLTGNSDIYIDWRGIGANTNITWNEEIINTLEIKKSNLKDLWYGIGLNMNFNWDSNNIRKYIGNAGKDFGGNPELLDALNMNLNVSLDKSIIMEYYHGRIIKINPEEVGWEKKVGQLLETNHDATNKLCQIKSIPWSIDLIERYEYYWNWKSLIINENIWNLVFKTNISEAFINSYLSQLNIAEYEKCAYLYQFKGTPMYFELNTKYSFGKHKGSTLKSVYIKDPDYIIFCIKKIDFFVIEEPTFSLLNDLNLNKKCPLSQDLRKWNHKKLMYYWLQKKQELYYEYQEAEDEYYRRNYKADEWF
jgi:hypothetical protein